MSINSSNRSATTTLFLKNENLVKSVTSLLLLMKAKQLLTECNSFAPTEIILLTKKFYRQ